MRIIVICSYLLPRCSYLPHSFLKFETFLASRLVKSIKFCCRFLTLSQQLNLETFCMRLLYCIGYQMCFQ